MLGLSPFRALESGFKKLTPFFVFLVHLPGGGAGGVAPSLAEGRGADRRESFINKTKLKHDIQCTIQVVTTSVISLVILGTVCRSTDLLVFQECQTTGRRREIWNKRIAFGFAKFSCMKSPEVCPELLNLSIYRLKYRLLIGKIFMQKKVKYVWNVANLGSKSA